MLGFSNETTISASTEAGVIVAATQMKGLGLLVFFTREMKGAQGCQWLMTAGRS